jgi:hypothetical protein
MSRQDVIKTGICPMCEDCPDGCPLESHKDSRNRITHLSENKDRLDAICKHYQIQLSDRLFLLEAISALDEDDQQAIGRWKGAGFGDYNCSLCSETVNGKTKYCPNCGAKMD